MFFTKELFRKVFFILPLLFIGNMVFAGHIKHEGAKTKKADKKAEEKIPAPPKDNSFENIDRQLEQLVKDGNFDVKDNEGFSDEYFEDKNTGDETAEEYKSRAKAAVESIESSNSYVDYIDTSSITQLPVGLTKKVGNFSVTIAITYAKFTKTYAELTAYAKIVIPQSPNEIFFGVEGLKLSYNGGIIGSSRLVLLGDINIPINGNNAALVLKGGINLTNGSISDQSTYVEIDCNGFKTLNISASVQFPRSILIPVDASGNEAEGNVTANINQLTITNWNDILTSITFPSRFEVAGLKGIDFELSDAVVDLSDSRNSTDINYPPGYQDKYMQKDNLSLWHGVYAKNISVYLPKSFKDRQDPTRQLSFGVNNLIIDNNGLSGTFYAENILPITKGTASGWKFSVDSFRLAIEANTILRAGFGGRVGIPVASTSSDNDTSNKRKFLAYSAVITSSSDYVCRVTTLDTLDFDLWKATVVLLPNSYIQLSGDANSFKPEAMLNGSISIVSQSTDDHQRQPGANTFAKLPGIQFQGLHITTDAPYISAQYFGYNGEIKIGNFPVTISEIALQKDPQDDTKLGVHFKMAITLQDNDFTGSSGLTVYGKLDQGEGIQSWKYSNIKIDDIYVNAVIKNSFKLEGYAKFMDDDPVYGDGFAGGITLTITSFKKPSGITVGTHVMFGKKDFRYWYVDGMVEFSPAIGGVPIAINGFGGGAYYRMTRTSQSLANADQGFTTNPTKINYQPDSASGLGLKAMVLFSVGSKSIAHGQASLEIAFNKGGGLKYIGLFGYAKILSDLKIVNGVQDYLVKQCQSVQKIFDTISAPNLEKLENDKIFDPKSAAQKLTPPEQKPGEEGLSAYLGIQYDFNASTLHANFDLYINTAGGMLRGVGDNNRAGWAVLHIAPDNWYLNIGTPSDPDGIKFGIGSFYIKTTAYFMAGDNIPAFPDPPSIVKSILAESGLQYNNAINRDDIGVGKGLAFGASVSINTGDIRFLIFYANFAAGLGFDVMLKDYGNATCNGNQVGINGWYAQGQTYAYLQGELGVKIKLLFIHKKISIIKGSAAALLQAKLPNPTYVAGYLGFHISILGGLISGSFNFKLSFGNDCQLAGPDVPDEESLTIIDKVTPDDATDNVSILSKPVLSLKIAQGQLLDVPKEDGTSGSNYYKAQVDQFKLYQGTTEISTKASVDAEGKNISLTPLSVLTPRTAYKITAMVSFQQQVNGKWLPVMDNGQKVQEIKNIAFTTGNAPDTLDRALIDKMYPFFDQRNYYKDEFADAPDVNTGKILLKQDYAPFFAKFNKWKIRVEDLSGNEVATVYATTSGSNLFSFRVPSNLQPQTAYRYLLLGEGPTDPSSDVNKPALKVQFTTSKYGTLAEKITTLNTTQAVIGRVSSDVIDLEAEVGNYEGFELYELAGNSYTGNTPMIQAEADLSNDIYYLDTIKPLVYPDVSPNTPNSPAIIAHNSDGTTTSFYVNNSTYGVPPVKAITISWYYLNALTTNEYNDLLQRRFPFVYNLDTYYNVNFLDLRTQVVNKYLGNTYGINGGKGNVGIPPQLQDLVSKGYPFMLKGPYKAKFKFTSLDGTTGSTGIFTYQNMIE